MIKKCLLCGKEFETDKKHNYQNYCSIFCNRKHYRIINYEAIKKKKADYYKLKKEKATPEEREKKSIKNNISRRKYYQKHIELEKTRSRNRYHSLEGQRYNKEYYQKYKQHIIPRCSKWAKANPQKIKVIQKRSYDKNREKVINRRLARRNTPEGREKYRHYARVYTKIKRGILKKQDHRLTLDEIKYIHKRDSYRCVYCGSENISPVGDHIIPLKEKGKDIIENVVSSCNNHNSSKNVSNVFEWCESRNIKVPRIVIKLLKKQDKMNIIPNTTFGSKIQAKLRDI